MTAIVGREAELHAVEALLDRDRSGPSALVLVGPAGIGKTTLWREGVRRAREAGYCVLAARPTGAEARLSFAALADLLEPVERQLVASLPAPQRRALDVALLRDDAAEGVEARSLGTALRSLLHSLAAHPLLVAVDDAQWLDLPTADALSFALRRLEEGAVRVLATVRSDDARAETFEHVLPPDRRRDLELGGLSLAALHELLKHELGLVLPRPRLVQVLESSAGNPFSALEIAREVVRAGRGRADRRLPAPREVGSLARERLSRLPRATRDELLLCACLARPTLALLDPEALAPAEEAGVLAVDDDRVRFVHPLFAAGVYDTAPAARRRAAHSLAAGRVSDPEERARHLALAVGGPDGEVAAALDSAATAAAARGAPAAAAELAELALRLTPAADTARVRRQISLGSFLYTAGDIPAAIETLERTRAEAPPGAERGEALVDLGALYTLVSRHGEGVALIDEGLAALDDPHLRARARARRAWASMHDLRRVADDCCAVIETVGDEDRALRAFALQYLAIARLFAGEAAEHELVEQAVLPSERPSDPWSFPWLGPLWATYFGDLERARALQLDLVMRAEVQGNESERQSSLCHLAHVDLWLGRPEEAERVAREALALAEQIDQPPMACVARSALATVLVWRGDAAGARAECAESLAFIGDPPPPEAFILAGQTFSALGSASFAADEPAEADRWFARAEEVLLPWPEPAPFWFHGEHAEAVIALGELDRAERLVAALETRAARIPRPWTCVVAARSRGLLEAARGDGDAALAVLQRAREPRLPFEDARTLLVQGQVLRRLKRKREARASLEQAAASFARLGAVPWLRRAEAELRRVAVRQAPRELSETELRIALLAADGLTNRAIAERAFVSVNTVEANLGRAYRKLGIRSRTQLARALAERERAAIS